MVTDRQVRKLRKLLSEGRTLIEAADAAGMSEKTARKWKAGFLPTENRKERDWRTREDPFADVWEAEVVPLLAADEQSELEATELLRVLQAKHEGRFHDGQLRTLQRRVSEWRALHGPDKEVYFDQVHPPGREGAFDFTNCNSLQVTIAGAVFMHLLFQFVLSYSKWRWVGLARSETFEAMSQGLQNAVWALGATPAVWRSDNLSAATHELAGGGRELTRRYRALVEHYGVKPTRISPGKSHENGIVEKAHDVLKGRLKQALILRGSRDFTSVDEYMAFVEQVVATLNAPTLGRLDEERAWLRPLPSTRVPAYTKYRATVRSTSTIHFNGRSYSVPSRLKGKTVEVRQHAEHIEVRYCSQPTVTMPRIRGEARLYRIDYRHIIWSLVRKPGAFAQYRYREELFPTPTFRLAYDALTELHGDRADVEYVRILHLAASTAEAAVDAALRDLLEGKQRFAYADVKARVSPEKPLVPDVQIPAPDLAEYDLLLAGGDG